MYSIDNQSRKAVYEQIVSQTERFVLTGIMSENQPIPSIRSLSVELSVNPNTIQKAYMVLENRGVIYSLPGRGSFISPQARQRLAEERRGLLAVIESSARECSWAGLSKDEIYLAVDKGYNSAMNGGKSND